MQHLTARITGTRQKSLVDVDDLQFRVGDDNALGVLFHRALELAQLMLTGFQRSQHVQAFLLAPAQAGTGNQGRHQSQAQHAQHIKQRGQLKRAARCRIESIQCP